MHQPNIFETGSNNIVQLNPRWGWADFADCTRGEEESKEEAVYREEGT